MRIIAGFLGGRSFDSPRGQSTHPMSEKMRGALFNTLGDLNGLTLLDAFSGSGALAYEAVSRGARSVVAIEQDTEAFKTITNNLKNLQLTDRVEAIRGNCAGWHSNAPDRLFDIVIADPPYEPKKLDLQLAFKLSRCVKPDGFFVLSSPPNQKATRDLRARPYTDLELLREKKYGDGSLTFYRRI